MRPWSGDTCLTDIYPPQSMWTKYGEPRLYDKRETCLLTKT